MGLIWPMNQYATHLQHRKFDLEALSLVKIDTKILNLDFFLKKVLANGFQEHITNIIHHNQVGFILKIQYV